MMSHSFHLGDLMHPVLPKFFPCIVNLFLSIFGFKGGRDDMMNEIYFPIGLNGCYDGPNTELNLIILFSMKL
jgi:hypothetical protein